MDASAERGYRVFLRAREVCISGCESGKLGGGESVGKHVNIAVVSLFVDGRDAQMPFF
jgi:hypothetical protein